MQHFSVFAFLAYEWNWAWLVASAALIGFGYHFAK